MLNSMSEIKYFTIIDKTTQGYIEYKAVQNPT